MGDLILSAAMFTGEASEKFVLLNRDEVEATAESENPVEKTGAYFMLVPVDGKIDAEYTKLRGQDTHTMKIRPKADGEDGPSVRFDAMEVSFSNERELKALLWLAKKVVKGWRGVMLDNGSELEFSEHNLEKLASYPPIMKPVIEEAYNLGRLSAALKEGNL
jgi:hypothetical protein